MEKAQSGGERAKKRWQTLVREVTQSHRAEEFSPSTLTHSSAPRRLTPAVPLYCTAAPHEGAPPLAHPEEMCTSPTAGSHPRGCRKGAEQDLRAANKWTLRRFLTLRANCSKSLFKHLQPSCSSASRSPCRRLKICVRLCVCSCVATTDCENYQGARRTSIVSQTQNAALILPPTDHEGHGRRLALTLAGGVLCTPDNAWSADEPLHLLPREDENEKIVSWLAALTKGPWLAHLCELHHDRMTQGGVIQLFLMANRRFRSEAEG